MPNDNTFETTIETLSHDGRGIAHINGKTTFIHGALPYEKVLFKYTARHGSFDEGQVIEILEKADERVTPLCPFYDVCGGCSLQHLDHQTQIIHKQNTLLNQLEHVGKTIPQNILPPLIGPIWGYRHKARLGVRFVIKKNKLLIGFREKNGRYLAEMDCCETLEPSVGKRIVALKDLISNLESYEEIPQIEIAVGDNATALIIRHLKPLSQKDTEQLIQFAKTYHFDLYLQPNKANSVHKIYPSGTPERLIYRLPKQEVELLFHPNDFTQINVNINQQMVQRVIELLDPNSEDEILDLFCGLGNFTIPLAKHCRQIVGIEGDDKMVKRGYENAKHNHITNADFFATDLTQDATHKEWFSHSYTKVLLDPPRSGAIEIISQLQQIKPKRIVYVSCNPATLARDTFELVHHQNYVLEKAGIMDMFPHTAHVESIALFILK